MRTLFERTFFEETTPVNAGVMRIVTAANALWIVLSRPNLPDLLLWPDAMWSTVMPQTHWRFLLLWNDRTEWALWLALHAALVLTLFGIATRWSALAAGLLLYHFAPLESIWNGGNPYLRGFTISVIALLTVAASASAGEFRELQRRSWEHRWPVVLIQFVFCSMYFFAGLSKLVTSGLEWMTAENMRLVILGLDQVLSFPGGRSGALFVADRPWLAAAVGVIGIAFELIFPLALFSRRVRIVALAGAVFFHIANYFALHIHFPEMALLVVFIDWQRLHSALTIPAWRQRWSSS